MNGHLYSQDEEASVTFRAHEPLWTLLRRGKIIFPAGDRSLMVSSVYEFGSVQGPLLQRRSGVWTDRSGLLMVRPVTGSCRPARPLCPVANGDLATTLTDNRNAARIQQSAAVRTETPLTAWPGAWETSPSLPTTNTDYYIPQSQNESTMKWDSCSTSPSISNLNHDHIPLRI
jgi:hypothetical protein